MKDGGRENIIEETIEPGAFIMRATTNEKLNDQISYNL
jgi:hypothetical protein